MLETCSEKKTRKFVLVTFKKCFSRFSQEIFEKKHILKGILGKTDKSFLADFGLLAIKGLGLWGIRGFGGEGMNPLKKEHLGQKSFSDNVK